jgi:hypothetical protein
MAPAVKLGMGILVAPVEGRPRLDVLRGWWIGSILLMNSIVR